jgi:signal transduction histidine kinase
MLGLRAKLLLGFVGLLLVMLLVSLLAERVMDHYSVAVERSYREDYGSVAACQLMKELVEQMDLAAQATLWEGKVDPAKLTDLETTFEQKLEAQRRAATLPGESGATDELSGLWKSYRGDVRQLLSPSLSADQRRSFYFDQLRPESLKVRLAAQRLIDMNLSAMLSVPGRSQSTARQAHWAMRTLTLSGTLLALVVGLMIGRIVLRPVRVLTETARQMEGGNFNLTVPVQSHDELGVLAMAFNSMAERLRAYRQLEHERLVRSERSTQLAIDSLPDAVLVLNGQGHVELSNEMARKLQILPGSDGRIAPPDWITRLWKEMSASPGGADANQSGYESTLRFELDEEEKFYLPRVAPITDEASQPIGATVVLADVTGLRRLDDMKNSLLSLVSHELKTPLTSARMILHLLAEQRVGTVTKKQLELLEVARDDSDRLHQIVENLLDMSRIESGKALMDLHPSDVQTLVEQSVAPLTSMFRAQSVALVVQCEANLPPVLADATRIGHVFANLLTNALRHTPSGGQVVAGAAQRDDAVEFFVSDSGEGIAPHHLHRVFEKFYRVPVGGSGGAGLGLAIVKDIVEAHGGQVRVSSVEGKGTTIAFTLQRASVGPESHPSDPSQNPVSVA